VGNPECYRPSHMFVGPRGLPFQNRACIYARKDRESKRNYPGKSRYGGTCILRCSCASWMQSSLAGFPPQGPWFLPRSGSHGLRKRQGGPVARLWHCPSLHLPVLEAQGENETSCKFTPNPVLDAPWPPLYFAGTLSASLTSGINADNNPRLVG
jgi:hypothetical protein